MVNVHNIIMMYIVSRHMYGMHGGVISGKEGLELHGSFFQHGNNSGRNYH